MCTNVKQTKARRKGVGERRRKGREGSKDTITCLMQGTVNEMMERGGGGGLLRKRARVEQGTNAFPRGEDVRVWPDVRV